MHSDVEPKVRVCEGRREVWDMVRGRYVALTPEEWVRQQMIQHLHCNLQYPLELMQVEGSISLNGMTKRCDIVVYGAEVKPMMIVECKQPSVKINQKVVDQICRYNMVLQVPYLCITNGPQCGCFKVEYVKKELKLLKNIPTWNELNM